MTRALRAKDTGGRDFLAPKCDAAQKAHAARMSVATHTFLSRGAKKAEKEAVHAANHTILAERARRQEAAGVPCPLEGPLHHGRGLLRDARETPESTITCCVTTIFTQCRALVGKCPYKRHEEGSAE